MTRKLLKWAGALALAAAFASQGAPARAQYVYATPTTRPAYVVPYAGYPTPYYAPRTWTAPAAPRSWYTDPTRTYRPRVFRQRTGGPYHWPTGRDVPMAKPWLR